MAPVGFLETSVIYCGDNLKRLAEFPTDCVDLIYLDPPFFSNRHYEVIWGDEAEVRSFEDRWSGGIEVYVDWMRERVMEIRRVLKETGSVYLHCDWHASHYLKVMMDEVFGQQHFQNEFVWYYSGGGASKRRWARKHDVLLFYTKGDDWTFNADAVRTPYKWTKGQLRADGSSRDLSKGKLADDVWEHHSLMPWSPERLGYPTQKPVVLLERIIKASSNPGDVVLDPFCGCGTTLHAAQNLGRNWIGLDISPTACGVMQRQLARLGQTIKIVGLPMTVDDLRALKPFEFQNWVIGRINGTHSPRKTGDMGIDGHTFFTHDPVQVKQSEGIGRNVVDNFETAIKREGRKVGYIVALSFGRGAREEVARAKAHEALEIELVEVQSLLGGTHPLARNESTVFGTEIAPVIPRDVATLPTVEELLGEDEGRRAAEEPEDSDSS